MNKSTAPPATSAQVACPCCLGTYRYGEKDIRRGKIQPNPACRQKRSADADTAAGVAATAKQASNSGSELDGALVTGACLIAAVRIARDPISMTDARANSTLTATVADSVRLARAVLAQM